MTTNADSQDVTAAEGALDVDASVARRALEGRRRGATMSERLLAAATRMGSPDSGERPRETRSSLHDHQARVLADVSTFLEEVATAPGGAASHFGRIVLPPRTGKTIIAAHVIAHARLASVFVVPTRTLVAQTVATLAEQLPDVPVGAYFGESKELVDDGVNVVTYAILQREFARGALPDAIADAALVFVDEAHHSMTDERFGMLERGFDERAVRVALTATPDYDERRVLCRFFPTLIHEITLEEALALHLLAPLRFWVAEIDEDASAVSLVCGDYDAEAIGALMSRAPFARALEVFRYHRSNASRPCLVACATRQQATDMVSYLSSHRPPNSPAPALLLGETSGSERQAILRAFEAGAIDTIVQVGVLVEGWNSPRCKLLVDLAPSTSRVRATQKYFRVMTRDGDREARIYILLPKGLPAFPVLPIDLFGASAREYECGELIGRESGAGIPRQAVLDRDHSGIERVKLVARILVRQTLEAPKLDPTRPADVLRVLRSCPDFHPEAPQGPLAFRSLTFNHRLFRGSGDGLLRWLGHAPTNASFERFLLRHVPDAAATRFLDRHGVDLPVYLQGSEPVPIGGGDVASSTLAEPPPDPFAALLRAERTDQLAWILTGVPHRRRHVLVRWCGLFGEEESTFEQIGYDEGISGGRAQQLATKLSFMLQFWDDERVALERRTAHKRGTLADLSRPSPIPPLESVTRPWRPMSRPLLPRDLRSVLCAWLSAVGVEPSALRQSPQRDRFSRGLLDVQLVTWADDRLEVLVERATAADPLRAPRRPTLLAEVFFVQDDAALRLWGDDTGFLWWGFQQWNSQTWEKPPKRVRRLESAWLEALREIGIG